MKTRRHHNNKGYRQIKLGHTVDQVKRIAAKLNIPYGEAKNMKKLANEIVTWLGNYAEQNNRKAFVVGVSGGVDSALVSTLCAMTGLPTCCVIIPCNSKPDGIKRAQEHIRQLQNAYPTVSDVTIDLSRVFGLFEVTIPPDFAYSKNSQLAFANAKSRLRMIALYQVATVNDGLVVGTGNKVEDFGVGFFTKYGDGGVDISPIADLTKTEVREMAQALGVNKEIVNAIPTDGLWEDTRSDESQLGATYKELEWAMAWMEGTKDCYSTVILEGLTKRQKEVLAIYTQRHASSRHKLEPIPMFKRTV